jgi:hypothetical protein
MAARSAAGVRRFPLMDHNRAGASRRIAQQSFISISHDPAMEIAVALFFAMPKGRP